MPRTFPRALTLVLAIAIGAGCGGRKRTATAITKARASSDETCTLARQNREAAFAAVSSATTALEDAKAALTAASTKNGSRPKAPAKASMYDQASDLVQAAERRLNDLRGQAEDAADAEGTACPNG